MLCDEKLFWLLNKNGKQKLQSAGSKVLTWQNLICSTCNNKTTQPYDKAWETLSSQLQESLFGLKPPTIRQANSVFPYDTERNMTYVQLYLAKLTGCNLKSVGIAVDLESLAKSIRNRAVSSNIFFVKFGYFSDGFTGISDLLITTCNRTDRLAFATWFYAVNGTAVNVMYAVDGESRLDLADWWHPKYCTNKLIIHAFDRCQASA